MHSIHDSRSGARRPTHRVLLEAETRLRDLLRHLYVLIPVLDDRKHYWVGEQEIEKLLHRGEGWLGDHPERDLILARYLKHRSPLTRRGPRSAHRGGGNGLGRGTRGSRCRRRRPSSKPRSRLHEQRLLRVGDHPSATRRRLLLTWLGINLLPAPLRSLNESRTTLAVRSPRHLRHALAADTPLRAARAAPGSHHVSGRAPRRLRRGGPGRGQRGPRSRPLPSASWRSGTPGLASFW